MNIDIEKEILKEVNALKELSEEPQVQEVVQEVVEKVVEQVQEVVEMQDVEKLTKTVVRIVDDLEPQQTFQCCLPFLSKFLVKKKQV